MMIKKKYFLDKFKINIKYCNNPLSIFINPFFLHRFFLKREISNFFNISKFNSKQILDIGCGEKPYQWIFNNNNYLGIDVLKSGREIDRKFSDIFYDGINFPFNEKSFDIILMFEVLEHVSNYQIFLNDISKLLKKNGILIVSTPFFWPLHEEPYDFHRISPYMFAKLSKYKLVKFFPIGNDFTSLFQTVNSFLFNFCGNKYLLFFIPVIFISNLIGLSLSFIRIKNKFPLGFLYQFHKK